MSREMCVEEIEYIPSSRKENDYLLKVVVNNNCLLRLMKTKGIETFAELARRTGADQGAIGRVAALKVSLYSKRKDGLIYYPKVLVALSEFFNVHPEALLPEELHGELALETNSAEREISAADVNELLTYEMSNQSQEVTALIDKLMEGLTPRQADVLSKRFGIYDQTMTLKAIGEEYGLGIERVRQVETKALQRLRTRTSKMSREENDLVKSFLNIC
jgi:hypothetical protein